jgi:hypothetical protein
MCLAKPINASAIALAHQCVRCAKAADSTSPPSLHPPHPAGVAYLCGVGGLLVHGLVGAPRGRGRGLRLGGRGRLLAAAAKHAARRTRDRMALLVAARYSDKISLCSRNTNGRLLGPPTITTRMLLSRRLSFSAT